MPAQMKKVRLADLAGQRVVDADGVEVRMPTVDQPPEEPQTSRDVRAICDAVTGAVQAGQVATHAQLIALAEIQQRIAVTLAAPRPQLQRVSIKVRREAGHITDMVATPEYTK